jgi:hypothetical protein
MNDQKKKKTTTTVLPFLFIKLNKVNPVTLHPKRAPRAGDGLNFIDKTPPS